MQNHTRIIEIFDDIQKKCQNAKLVLVGTGAQEGKIKELVNSKSLENNVLFLGMREDVSDLLSMFDVFLLPSLYEGLPFVAIEAQAASLPVISSDTVSSGICITSLVKMLSLDDDDEHWSKCITESILSTKQRESDEYIQDLEREGYDINKTVSMVERGYIRIRKKKRGKQVMR